MPKTGHKARGPAHIYAGSHRARVPLGVCEALLKTFIDATCQCFQRPSARARLFMKRQLLIPTAQTAKWSVREHSLDCRLPKDKPESETSQD
eukprot:3732263-Amphidinium_carterae.1